MVVVDQCAPLHIEERFEELLGGNFLHFAVSLWHERAGGSKNLNLDLDWIIVRAGGRKTGRTQGRTLIPITDILGRRGRGRRGRNHSEATLEMVELLPIRDIQW